MWASTGKTRSLGFLIKRVSSYKIEISFEASLDMMLSNKRIIKGADETAWSASRSAPLLFASPEDRFSRVEAHVYSGVNKHIKS